MRLPCFPTACSLCADVKLLPEEFRALGARDKRFQNVRVILLIPKCSVSAISNPVGFLLQENGGTCSSEGFLKKTPHGQNKDVMSGVPSPVDQNPLSSDLYSEQNKRDSFTWDNRRRRCSHRFIIPF